MSSLTVSDVARLQPTCPIRSVAGRIVKLFPIERPKGWHYQNGFMKDEAADKEIRFQLKNWDREISVSEYEGGFIELTASDDESLVWKLQQKRKPGETPIVKLEIMQTATVVRLIPAAEFKSNDARGRLASPPAAATARVSVPEAPTPFPPQAAPSWGRPDGATSNVEVQREVRQLGALFLLCSDEASGLLKNVSTPEMVTATAGQLFACAAGHGIHRNIDLARFWQERDPARAAQLGLVEQADVLPPHVTRIAALIGSNEERERRANKMLRELGHIKKEQTWKNLTDERAREILEAGFFQVALAA